MIPQIPVADPPATALRVFGAQLPLVRTYARLLASDGVQRGLIGPREADRLWERHLLNCAVVAELLPFGARVVDVGSGAGLPGVVLACVRPDLSVDLVESTKRRTAFLGEVCDLLGLRDRIRVVQGRAEDGAVRAMVGEASWVCARAVAPLGQLVRWCVPMLIPGGSLLAIKGEQAAAEVETARTELHRFGTEADVVRCGTDVLDDPTIVVVVRRQQRRTSRRGVDRA